MALNTLESRSNAEKRKDAFRRPFAVLEFAGLSPKQRVLDVGTGFGYWAEFIASISEHRVDCQNATEWKSFFEYVGFSKSTARLRKLEQKYRFFWYGILYNIYDNESMQYNNC